MTKLILWGSVIWLAPLLCYMLVNETKSKKNIILGVTLPAEGRSDPAVEEETKRFRRNEWTVCALLILLGVLAMLPVFHDVSMTLWMIWIDLCIVLPYIPYVLSRNKLLKIEEERGWKRQDQTVKVDTAAWQEPKWLSPWLFVPPFLLALLPVFFDRGMWPVYLIDALCIIFFWFGYRYLYSTRSEMVDGDTGLTQVLTRIRRVRWGRVWLFTAYSMAALNIAFYLFSLNKGLGVALFVTITVFICVIALQMEMKMRQLQEKLTASSGKEDYVDDDEHWIGGIFYYNPNDRRSIVNHRIGLNTTVNLASGLGKVMIVMSIVLLLGLPFFGVWMDHMGSSEITVSAEEGEVSFRSGMTHYEFSKESIQEVTLLEELPQDLRRRFGTAMDTYLEGDFVSDEYGRMKLLLDPTVSPWLLIRTDEKLYLFGTREGQLTRDLYVTLSE